MENIKKFSLNPVFLKELKGIVRNKKLCLTLMTYNIIMGLVGTVALYVIFYLSGSNNVNAETVMGLYLILTLIEFFLICFAIPAYTSGSISGEREKQTLEILLTTPMSTTSIAMGKLLSGMSTILLLVISSMPVLALVFTIGGISFGDIALYMLFILVTSIYVGSIGVYFSARFKKTSLATVFTYATLIFLGIGTCIVTLLVRYLGQLYLEGLFDAGKLVQYREMDLGYGVLMLMVNPGVSWGSLAMQGLGGSNTFYEIITEFGTVPQWIITYWFYISMAVQLLLSAIIIKRAGVRLDPTKVKNKNRIKRKRKE